jgi:hypothetical protein
MGGRFNGGGYGLAKTMPSPSIARTVATAERLFPRVELSTLYAIKYHINASNGRPSRACRHAARPTRRQTPNLAL